MICIMKTQFTVMVTQKFVIYLVANSHFFSFQLTNLTFIGALTLINCICVKVLILIQFFLKLGIVINK